MARPPRAPDEGLLDRVWVRLLVGGAAIGAAIFASFLIGAETSHAAGQTMAFTTLVFGRLLFVFTVRGEGPFWRAGRNPRLFGAVALSAAVALVVLLVPAVGFGTVGLRPANGSRRWGWQRRRSWCGALEARSPRARGARAPRSAARQEPGHERRRGRSHRVRRGATPLGVPAASGAMTTAFAIALVFVFAFAFTNGVHDASNAIATLVATRGATPAQAMVLAAFFNTVGPLVVGAAVADTIGGIVAVDGRAAIDVIGAGLVAAVAWNLLHLVARAPVELGPRARRRARRCRARRGRHRRRPLGRP